MEKSGGFDDVIRLSFKVMKLFNRAMFAVATTCAAASVLAYANPYQPIAERNPFGLKAPPVQKVDEPPPVVVPLAKVVLTGITSMFGPTPRALLEITEQEPGKAPNTKKPILREGERDGSVEVLSIDVVKNMVRIKNGTVETNVTFELAKLSGPAPGLPTGPGMAPAPGPGQHPVPGMPQAGFRPTTANPAPTIIGGADNPGRANSGVTTYGAGDKPLPLRQVRTDIPGLQPTTSVDPNTGLPTSTGRTGADLLRETARARGLPVPPLPDPTTVPTR